MSLDSGRITAMHSTYCIARLDPHDGQPVELLTSWTTSAKRARRLLAWWQHKEPRVAIIEAFTVTRVRTTT